jgi:hypothetical protein
MWTQIVGKVKLDLSPFLNEWWNVAFAVTARGLSTSTRLRLFRRTSETLARRGRSLRLCQPG